MRISSAEEYRVLLERDDVSAKEVSTIQADEAVWSEIVESYPELRFAVAQNKTVPPSILRVLAISGDPRVRSMVARRRATPPEILKDLASDSSGGVRLAVAMNPSAPRDALAILAGDSWTEVALKARSRL